MRLPSTNHCSKISQGTEKESFREAPKGHGRWLTGCQGFKAKASSRGLKRQLEHVELVGCLTASHSRCL